MNKTRISTIKQSKIIDYGEQPIKNFWLKINENTYSPENNNLYIITNLLSNIQDSVVCIQTEELDHPKFINAIFSAASKRNRIYIITNEKDNVLKQLEGVCLIRYGIKNIGSFILVNPDTFNSKGLIFTAPFKESSLANNENICLELDPNQINVLFRFFSDNFWNKTSFEIIESYDSTNKISDPPLDILPNINDFCDYSYIKHKISQLESQIIFSIPNIHSQDIINFSRIKDSVLLTSLTNNNDDLLYSLAGQNNRILANEIVTTRILLNVNGESWLIPKTNLNNEDNIFALKLNKVQINKLNNYLLNLFEDAQFEFHSLSPKNELLNLVIRLNDNTESEIRIEEEFEKTLKDIKLDHLMPEKDFSKIEPEFINDTNAIKVKYNWNVIPLYTPAKAKEDKIYSEWNKCQEKYNVLLNKIGQKLKESNSLSISENMKQWFLGKKQKITQHEKTLKHLESITLSKKNHKDLKHVVDNLNDLASQVYSDFSEIENRIKTSNLEAEITELKIKKTNLETELKEWIKITEKELNDRDRELEQNISKFCEDNGIKKENLKSFKSELHQKTGKKNKKRNPQEAESAQKILTELKNIEGFNYKNKFEEEKGKREKELKKINDRIAQKEIQKKKTIEIDNNNSKTSSLNIVISGNKNNADTNIQNNIFTIPDDMERLPKIGTLYEEKGQRYLEIEFWEDYDLAKNEANRLTAKLSAKPLNE